MRPPRSFLLGAHRWRLLVDVDEMLINDACHGQCVPRRKTIAVDGALEGTALAEVVLHELVHAALSGLVLDDDVEEQIAQGLAGPLLEVLRRNPPLVHFLVG